MLYDYKQDPDDRFDHDERDARPSLWAEGLSWETTSCLTWRSKPAAPATWHELKVNGSKFRSAGYSDEKIPPGWVERDLPRCGEAEPPRGGWAFLGPDIDATTEQGPLFNYPVPIRDPTRQYTLTPQSEILSTQTSRARFRAIRSSNSQLWMNIADVDDKFIGVLRLSQRLASDSCLVIPKGTIYRPSDPLEYVLISKGSAKAKDDADALLEQHGSGLFERFAGRHEFYNVLWVERDDDGAFSRQGLGRIARQAWDLVVGDEIEDIVLK